MGLPRHTSEYVQGVEEFVQYAFAGLAKANTILCLCRKCVNSCWKEASVVRVHLICDGFLEGYNRWIFHGEASSCSGQQNVYAEIQVENNFEEGNEMFDMLRDVAHGFDGIGDLGENKDSLEEDPCEGAEDFYHLVGDANQELYLGCKQESSMCILFETHHQRYAPLDRSMIVTVLY